MSVLVGIGLFFAGGVIGVAMMALVNASGMEARCEECHMRNHK